MVREQLFKPIYAAELIFVAKEDMKAALVLASSKIDRVENVFLMAQQGLEKCLKAVLCAYGQPIPFIHDIGALVATLRPIVEPPFGYQLNSLSEYATIRRYYEGYDRYTAEELISLLKSIQDAVAWCETQVSQKLSQELSKDLPQGSHS